MDAKHQFKYTYSDTNLEEFSPVEVTFDMPGDVTLTQMLYNFQSYLKACGFYFDGHLEIVDETLKDLDLIDELDGTLYEIDKQEEFENQWDQACGCESTSSSLEKFNEGLDKLEKEIKEQKKIREMANKSADMVKDFNDAYEKLTEEQKMKCYEEALKMSGLHEEVKKSRWFHGFCNPPSPDWKKK